MYNINIGMYVSITRSTFSTIRESSDRRRRRGVYLAKLCGEPEVTLHDTRSAWIWVSIFVRRPGIHEYIPRGVYVYSARVQLHSEHWYQTRGENSCDWLIRLSFSDSSISTVHGCVLCVPWYVKLYFVSIEKRIFLSKKKEEKR